MRKGINLGAMTRIERGLRCLAQLTNNMRNVPRKTLGSMRIDCTDDGVNARLEQTMQKIELYIDCRRKPTTLERALQRAVAAHGARQ